MTEKWHFNVLNRCFVDAGNARRGCPDERQPSVWERMSTKCLRANVNQMSESERQPSVWERMSTKCLRANVNQVSESERQPSVWERMSTKCLRANVEKYIRVNIFILKEKQIPLNLVRCVLASIRTQQTKLITTYVLTKIVSMKTRKWSIYTHSHFIDFTKRKVDHLPGAAYARLTWTIDPLLA